MFYHLPLPSCLRSPGLEGQLQQLRVLSPATWELLWLGQGKGLTLNQIGNGNHYLELYVLIWELKPVSDLKATLLNEVVTSK